MDAPLHHASFKHNPSPLCLCLCPRARQRVRALPPHQQRQTAFNEGGGGKINAVPLKRISSHPIIAFRFHQFTVWERTCWRGRKCELWHRCANISLSPYLRLYLFPPLQLRTGGFEHRGNGSDAVAGGETSKLSRPRNIISLLRTSPLFFSKLSRRLSPL